MILKLLSEEHQADPFMPLHIWLTQLPLPKSHCTTWGNILATRSGLAHNIFLGPLATQESGPVIQLSVLQLFDLATALDEYAADVVALPAFNRSRVTAGPSAWASIAVLPGSSGFNSFGDTQPLNFSANS